MQKRRISWTLSLGGVYLNLSMSFTYQVRQDPCAQQDCQHSVRDTLHWAVPLDQRVVWLIWSGKHTNSIRETPQ